MRLLARQFNRLRCTKGVIYKEPDFSRHESQHMPERDTKPEASDQVFDAVEGNWVDTMAPVWAQGYLRLSRIDRPIGTWLLLIPCWWGGWQFLKITIHNFRIYGYFSGVQSALC